MRRIARRLGPLSLLLVLLQPLAVRGQDPAAATAAPVTEEEVAERLLELQDEIERLLPFLSPELRQQIARRLAERAAAQQVAAQQAVAASAAEKPSGETGEPGTEPGTESSAKPSARATCNTLVHFDTRPDGRIDAGDRFWRYLHLWTDANGNGEVEDREVRSAFDAGVRGISVRVDRFESEKGGVGLIRIDRWIVFDPRGDGFAGGIGGSTDDGALTVDASALGRFSGPKLLDADGQPLNGMQPFRPGLRLRDESGQIVELSCP